MSGSYIREIISYSHIQTLAMATPLRASILLPLTPRRIERHVDTSPLIIQKGRVKVAIPRYDLKERCGQVRRTLSTVLSR